MRKIKIALSFAAILAASPPLLGSTAIAQTLDAEEKSVQAAGYIGQLSKSALANNMLERMSLAGVSAAESLDRNTGDATLDRKARIAFWHGVALDAVALDHTPVDGEATLSQGGPTRTSRALAMIQTAVFDAHNSAAKLRFNPYNEFETVRRASKDAAIAKAAYDMLVALYPEQEDRFTDIFNDDLELIAQSTNIRRIDKGVTLGSRAAAAMLANRVGDNSNDAEPSFGEGGVVADGATTFFGTPVNGGTMNIGEWEPDPNTPEFAGEFNLSLGAFWGGVTPFVLNSGDQFRTPVPPLVGETDYTAAYNEVASLGGSPENVNTPSTGTDATRFIGNFWGYDGVPLIGVPPRIYNQIAVQIAADELNNPLKFARALAMVNVAMADVGIAAWDSKYFYNYWRPVTGIRRDDGSPDTATDPVWDPVGTSVVNTTEPIRPTPPFPAYPSGHAAFGATIFEIMRDFFGDDTPFTFVSDEFNGEGFDPFFPDVPRPLVPVRFETLTQAQEDNGDSRIFNGVHWQFDNTAGQEQGELIARFLLDEVDAFQRND